MLIKCPECGHDVSSTAEKCPNCGAAVAQTEKELNPREINTIQMIEFTPKRYKAQRIQSWALFFAGFFITFVGMWNADGVTPAGAIGFIIMLVSFVWGAIISFNVWWHHR